MTPRIAIPVPTTWDLAYNQRSWPNYANAVMRSGGVAVAIALELSDAELRQVVSTCDGVLLTGSPADVNPDRYGAERDLSTAAADPGRERVDFFLLDDAEKHGKPVLGICFGMQSLNVWRGGSLVQDLMPMPVNHSAGSKIAVAHTVQVAQGSLLADMLGPGEAPEVDGFLRLPVNTSHHQAVAIPGAGLRVTARSPEDGVIEAVELDVGAPVFHVEHFHGQKLFLGVQWHPERSFEISAASRAMFARLIAEAREVREWRRDNVAEGAVS